MSTSCTLKAWFSDSETIDISLLQLPPASIHLIFMIQRFKITIIFFMRFMVSPFLNWKHLGMWHHREYLLVAPQSAVNPVCGHPSIQQSWLYEGSSFLGRNTFSPSLPPWSLPSSEENRLSLGNNIMAEGYRRWEGARRGLEAKTQRWGAVSQEKRTEGHSW